MKVNQLAHYDLKTMRTLEEIKKDQDEAIFHFGAHLMIAEQFKAKILKLAEEAALIPKQVEIKPEDHILE